MFGRRGDGKIVKDLQIIEKAGAYFMPQRIDAVNLYTQPINCETLDKFILEEKKNSGIHYTYTEILIAAAVRMLYERPKTNRFVVRSRIYQRDYISVSMVIKKSLKDDGGEDNLKFFFTGRESLAEVKKIIDDEIAKNMPVDAETHKTTAAAGILCKLPSFMFRWAMGILRFLDNRDMLPGKLINNFSPFHTSMFVTDLRSIKLGKLYHHLYNFGTTSIFGALGKVEYVPVSDRTGEVKVEKRLSLGLSLDERICDGLYYGNSVKLLLKYIENPELMKERLPEPELTGKALKAKQKADKKAAKKQAKLDKKNAKKSK